VGSAKEWQCGCCSAAEGASNLSTGIDILDLWVRSAWRLGLTVELTKRWSNGNEGGRGEEGVEGGRGEEGVEVVR